MYKRQEQNALGRRLPLLPRDDGARAPDGARAGAAADEKPTLVQSAREIENALDDVAGSRRAASLRG